MRSAHLMSIPRCTGFRSDKVSRSRARRGSLQNYRVWSRRFLRSHRDSSHLHAFGTTQQVGTGNYKAGSAVEMPRFAAARVGLVGAYVPGKVARSLALRVWGAESYLSLGLGYWTSLDTTASSLRCPGNYSPALCVQLYCASIPINAATGKVAFVGGELLEFARRIS